MLHGFGFGGTLGQIGLQETDIPLALLFFNLGAESGQVLIIAVVLIWLQRKSVKLPEQGVVATVYAVGCLASFWLFEPLGALFV